MNPPEPADWRKAKDAKDAKKPPPEPEWLLDDKHRILKGHLHNIRLALRGLGVTSSYNAFARELRIDNMPVVDDIALQTIWTRIADTYGWQPNRINLQTVLLVDARTHAMTHPVREYLDRLVWDNTPRLDRWLVNYAGAKATAYVLAVSPLPLLAAVRRVRHPGAKFDELLVLESKQGTLKSTSLRILCGDEWFSDDLPLGVDSKQVIERTSGRWILEAAELLGNRGRETNDLKAFLSRQVDGPVRLAYTQLPVSIPRQFVIIGTTNHRTNYLKDMTGARRFWPVALKAFDIKALTRDRDQLWAEAAQREPGASIRLPQTLWKKAAAEQEERRAIDPWEELIEARLSDGLTRVTRISAAEIWQTLGVQASFRNNNDAGRVTAIMEFNGYRKGKSSRSVWELEKSRGKKS